MLKYLLKWGGGTVNRRRITERGSQRPQMETHHKGHGRVEHANQNSLMELKRGEECWPGHRKLEDQDPDSAIPVAKLAGEA